VAVGIIGEIDMYIKYAPEGQIYDIKHSPRLTKFRSSISLYV
jgi:hypothetical protein